MEKAKKLIWGDNIMYTLCYLAGGAVGLLISGIQNVSTVNWVFLAIMGILLFAIILYSNQKKFKQEKPVITGSTWLVISGLLIYLIMAIITYLQINDDSLQSFSYSSCVIGAVIVVVVMAVYSCLTKKVRDSIPD